MDEFVSLVVDNGKKIGTMDFTRLVGLGIFVPNPDVRLGKVFFKFGFIIKKVGNNVWKEPCIVTEGKDPNMLPGFRGVVKWQA